MHIFFIFSLLCIASIEASDKNNAQNTIAKKRDVARSASIIIAGRNNNGASPMISRSFPESSNGSLSNGDSIAPSRTPSPWAHYYEWPGQTHAPVSYPNK